MAAPAAAAAAGGAAKYRVLVSGATGLIGRALVGSLATPSAFNRFNPEICFLVRRRPEYANEVYWNPYEMHIDLAGCEGFDAVVHLAGENVGSGGDGLLGGLTGRWGERKKHMIMESRRRGTQLLAQALAAVKAKPSVLVSASGVGYYGSRGDDVLTEASAKGAGFLADVSDVWESSTAAAARAGIRVVNTRFGVVLSQNGGALGACGEGWAGWGGLRRELRSCLWLRTSGRTRRPTPHSLPPSPRRLLPRPPARHAAKLYWPFYLGGGGPIGSGAQWTSWVTIDDAVRAIEFALKRDDISGPINVVAPGPVRSAEFTGALARALRRPHLLPLPEPVVRGVFGEMGEETLLASQRAVPDRLTAAGFRFAQPDIDAGITAALHPAPVPPLPRGRPLKTA
jgi:uncharacterized protein